MFKKTLKYFVLILSLFLWIQAYSPIVYKFSKLFPDDYRYGDLYRLANLPQFKEFQNRENAVIPKQKLNNNTNLFVIGDSFTEKERVSPNNLVADTYTNVHWSKQAEIQLDTSLRNVLILETVERTFKEHFSVEVKNFTFKENNKGDLVVKKSWKRQIKDGFLSSLNYIFPNSEGIELRLEHTIFNYDFFLFFKELKAKLNLELFDRVGKNVVISKKKDAIFYYEEADYREKQSAFYPVSQDEIDVFVAQINATKAKYQKAGFDEVYLSIIPNKTSIMSPDLGNYNHLIELIQKDKRVNVPIIDTYSEFSKFPQKYYLKSDSHWNTQGRDIWLEKVNNILSKP
jgi:hypothetical protein